MRPRWIWLPEAPGGIGLFMLARHVVTSSGGSARIRIACDGRYMLYVNGERVGRGPVRGRPQDRFVDAYDVTLRSGENVVGIVARNDGRPSLSYLPPRGRPPGGVIADVGGIAGTDASWRVLRAPYTPLDPAPQEGAPDPEVLDGRAWPWGWLTPGFDDSGWVHAVECDGPDLDALPPRPIPHLTERDLPMGRLKLRAGERRTLDLGTITNAHVTLAVRAEAGTEVEVRCGEDREGDEVLLDVRDWFLRYTAAGTGGTEQVEAFEPVGFRYLQVRADAGASVEVVARERTYPRAPGAWFRSSDEDLDAIWLAGVRTLELCSTDTFIDCPGREQRAWLGDDYVASLISMTVSPDLALVVRDLRMHAAGQRDDGLLPMVAGGDFTQRAHTLPDQSLLWIGTLTRVYEHTGDVGLVRELLPVARGILDAFEAMRADDGLISGYVHGLEGWWFIDWAQIQRGDRIAAVDALYAIALRDMARLCAAAGEPADVYDSRYGRTRTAFERYWDDQRGAYRDAMWDDGREGRRISQQANAAAICAGIVPPERTARVIERITAPDRLRVTLTPGDGGTFGERLNRQWQDPPGFDDEEHVVAAQPAFMHVVHRAFVAAGRHDLLLPSIRRWREMVARNGLVEEYWTALPGMGSRCHAWAGTPTYDLVASVLGVRPAEPGWSSLVVDPHLGDLAWAEARVPTPRGWLEVRAERGAVPVVTLPNGAELANELRPA